MYHFTFSINWQHLEPGYADDRQLGSVWRDFGSSGTTDGIHRSVQHAHHARGGNQHQPIVVDHDSKRWVGVKRYPIMSLLELTG